MNALRSVNGDTAAVQDTARLDREISHLSAQNERLLKSVDTLLSLHESEKAQRQSLQATLDRLLETVGSELRTGVSQDLEPLLHAIIELLELSARRGPTVSPAPPDSREIAAADSLSGVAKPGGAAGQLPLEDVPGALPEILTKSIEELVGKRRPETNQPRNLASRGKGQHGVYDTHRPHGWIPVTSSTLDS